MLFGIDSQPCSTSLKTPRKKNVFRTFITKFARVYTPAVVGCAVLLAFIPPLLFAGQVLSAWVYRALTFWSFRALRAVISVPLAFFGGIGGASRAGVLVKGGNYLEALAHAQIAVFDKTGTLTKGVFDVTDIFPEGVGKDALIETAAYAEYYSNHPIAASLRRAYGREIDASRIAGYEETAGYGISANVAGVRVLAGSAGLMARENVAVKARAVNGTAIHIARGGVYMGCIVISDVIKENAPGMLRAIKALGVEKTVMLTGDGAPAAKAAAEALGIDLYYFGLLPQEKVAKIEDLLAQKNKKGRVIFFGDGINDAPVLARADVGVAMGALGSDAAIEAADVVLMTDELAKIPQALKIARRTRAIANQNIFFALAVKFGVLILGALGLATMWEAVFADVGVALIAVANAMRTLNIKKIIAPPLK
jgi:Cd2+/Zn2+-exporting ATPase